MADKIKNAVKIIVILLLILLLAFAIVSLVWYIRYSVMYKPLIENDNLTLYDETDFDTYRYFDEEVFSESADEDNWSYYGVNIPHFLDFGSEFSSNVYVRTPRETYEQDGITISFSYKASFSLDDRVYYWDIQDLTSDNQPCDVEIYTDSNLNLISQLTETNCELTYDDCYEYMLDFYNTYLVSILGEDCFPKL
ncbi:MAG: hypothetical protein LUE12_04930 [Ruminococcus sp.]|nr:hypothetical protein [Ruminococcus sp.]